jgi:hypothetical protein
MDTTSAPPVNLVRPLYRLVLALVTLALVSGACQSSMGPGPVSSGTLSAAATAAPIAPIATEASSAPTPIATPAPTSAATPGQGDVTPTATLPPGQRLHWACVRSEGQGSPPDPKHDPPNTCLPLPPCYFAATCQLTDHAWIAPSRLSAADLTAACADIAAAHRRPLAACRRDIRTWDYQAGWGVEDYIYAPPGAPVFQL